MTPIWEDVVFTSSTSGWAVGFAGKIIHTTTGGITHTRSEQAAIEKVELFPNPTQGDAVLRATFRSTATVSLEIISADGKILHVAPSKKVAAGTANFELPSGSWPSGIYCIKLKVHSQGGHEEITRRLVR